MSFAPLNSCMDLHVLLYGSELQVVICSHTQYMCKMQRLHPKVEALRGAALVHIKRPSLISTSILEGWELPCLHAAASPKQELPAVQ